MKYQQLENLECGWKWNYLVKNGKKVSRSPATLIQVKLTLLLKPY